MSPVSVLAPQLVLWTGLACATQPPPAQPPLAEPGDRFREVLIVDQAGLDALRAGGRHVLSGPQGEVAATAPCASGNVDALCLEAARQLLREEATRPRR